jgi:two-component system sensor histidine kinase BaeS
MKIKRTFGRRLLIGIILPVLVLVPLLGLGLIYFLETRLILRFILGALLVGLLIAGIITLFWYKSVNRQIKAMTAIIVSSPLEGQAQRLPENGDSEFLELARTYNQLQDRRQELEKRRQQMLANLIHEIGRPLGSLRTALHALQSGAVNDQPLRSDLMKGMSERIDRMGRLLEDLALVYRGLEPQEFHLQSVQINEWMESLTPVWAESARQKQLAWEVVFPEDIPIIQTDPDRLAQALSNLVNNAIKFTPSGGKVTLTADFEESTLQILVSDTGIGIPTEEQQYLFAPFYRSAQPSWKAPGLGLGLSIAKSIIESLEGNISLASTSGKGSIFKINLPIK